MSAPSLSPSRPTRRALLAGGLAGLTSAALAGCTDATAPAGSLTSAGTPAASPADAAAVGRARAAAADLAAGAERLALAGGSSGRLLTEIAADHRAHLAALGGAIPSPVPTPGAPTSGPAGRATLAAVARAEGVGAQTALDDVLAASPDVAALLARIAAARAAHADLLSAAAGVRLPRPLTPSAAAVAAAAPVPPASPGPDAGPLPPPPAGVQPPTPEPTPAAGAATLAGAARNALVALTAGEHAAVFAYGLVAARVPAEQRDRARDAWSWHLARRDRLEDRLLTAGVEPPAARPAYDVGGAPTPDGAARLAATVEQRVSALALRTVAATTGEDRGDAAAALVAGARRAAAWSGRAQALPG